MALAYCHNEFSQLGRNEFARPSRAASYNPGRLNMASHPLWKKGPRVSSRQRERTSLSQHGYQTMHSALCRPRPVRSQKEDICFHTTGNVLGTVEATMPKTMHTRSHTQKNNKIERHTRRLTRSSFIRRTMLPYVYAMNY